MLVTVTTTPAWTPLFPVLAGLVTETGGILSHAAVVAREYGIPAVVGAEGATSEILDGTRVIVDGTAGQVRTAAREAPEVFPSVRAQGEGEAGGREGDAAVFFDLLGRGGRLPGRASTSGLTLLDPPYDDEQELRRRDLGRHLAERAWGARPLHAVA